MAKTVANSSSAKPEMAAASQTDPSLLPASSDTALRILLVDDHTIIRDGLKQILSRGFPQALFGEARNAREALTNFIPIVSFCVTNAVTGAAVRRAGPLVGRIVR